MTDFYLTRMGQRFYEHTVPELVRQLQRLNQNLERIADQAERDHPAGDHPRDLEGDRHDHEDQED